MRGLSRTTAAGRPLALADLNQDGFNDIITSNHGTAADEGSISVLINTLVVSTTP
jgi:hypothetical protein